MPRDMKGRFAKKIEGFNLFINIPSFKMIIFWLIITNTYALDYHYIKIYYY